MISGSLTVILTFQTLVETIISELTIVNFQ
jgi:hypothetical protein